MTKLAPIRCPNCNKQYHLPASLNNKQVVCKRCQHQFRVESDVTQSATSDPPMPGSIFDALDVDDLLNAPSSGLEKAKPKRKLKQKPKRPPAARPTDDAGNDDQPPQSSPVKKSKSPLKPEAAPANPNPELIENELEFAWANKRKQQKLAKSKQLATSAVEEANYAGPQNSPELDEEELAVYVAVTRQNRRRNLLCAVVVAALVVVVGGFFANQEYENISVPLTEVQRDWLTDRGFILKARRVANINGDEGASVLLAAGKSFADIDMFATKTENAKDLKANAPDGLRGDKGQASNRQRHDRAVKASKPKKQVRQTELPLVDFDTRVDPDRATIKQLGPTKTIDFSSPTVLASTPRNQFYIAGPQFIKGVSSSGEVFEQRTLVLPSSLVTAIVATDDGQRVIVGGDGGVVQAYRLDAKGRLTQQWTLKRVHRDKIIHLLMTADSKRLVVYSADGRMTIWDIDSQSVEVNLSDLVPQERLQSLRLVKDEVLILSSDGIRRFKLGGTAVEFESFDRRYQMFSPNLSGEKIVYGDVAHLGLIDHQTKLVDWSASMRIVDQPHVKFSPDQMTAFYFDGGRDVLHFEVSSGRLLHRFGDDRFGDDRLESVRSVDVSADGKTLLVSGAEDRINLFSVPDVMDLSLPKLNAPSPSPSRNYPPVTTEDQPVDQQKSRVVANVLVAAEKISAMCMTDNGFLIAATNGGRTVVYDWTKSRVVDERFETESEEITFLTTSLNRLLIGRKSGMVEIIEITPDGKLDSIERIAGLSDPITYLNVISDTPHMVSVTESGHVHVFDLQTKTELYNGRPLKPRVQSVAIDRRSDLLLVDGNELVTLDYKTGKVKTDKGSKRIRNVKLLPDGKRLAFFDRDEVKLATTSRGEINLSFAVPTKAKSISFSPDAKLAFVFADDEIVVYRLRGGKELFRFKGPKANETIEMVFSGDGKFMTPFYPGINGSFDIYAVPMP